MQNPKHIAAVAHAANRALTKTLQDVPLQPEWESAPDEMIRSSVQGVVWRLNNPTAPASAQHEEWCRSKIEDGWKWGASKDSELKLHPALVPYEVLPAGVQLKDKVFTAIVLAMASAE